jgi:hypothetical protein
VTTGEEAEQQDELAAQLQAATEAFQRTAGRLLREGETHPQLVVLAAARVAGELGAGMAMADGQDLEELLGELADLMRQAGREFHDELEAEPLPPAGNA